MILIILHGSDDSIKLEPQWEKKDFDILKQTIWFEGVRNAYIIQAVNYKEVMKALPKILRYFTGKLWGFPLRTGIQSKQEYKTLKRSEVQCHKAIDLVIEEFASIVESLDSLDDKSVDQSRTKNVYNI